MQSILDFCAAHPFRVLGTLFVITLAAATQLNKVRVQVSADELLVLDDPERTFYAAMRERFADEKAVLVYLHDSQILAPEKLEALREVNDELTALPFVARVESLFSIPHLKTVDGYLDKAPYLAHLPETPQQSQALLAQALGSPFIRNVLLSPDGQGMALAVILEPTVTGEDDHRVTSGINSSIRGLERHYEEVFAIGFPYVRTEIAERIRQEQSDLFPLAVAALLLALFILLRQVVDILAPVMTALLSIVWTLGLMGLLDIPLNVVTSIVPVLLVVVGSTEDIHLLAEFRRGQQLGLDPHGAVNHMARKMGRTVLLTFITTYAGFLSVSLSGIEVLWQFGLLASSGLLLNFLITVTLIPALVALAGRWRLGHKPAVREIGQRVAEAYWALLYRNRWRISLVLLGFSGVFAAAVPAIQVNHSIIDSLGRDSLVREHVQKVSDRLAGLESLSIIIDSGIQDTFLKVRYLEELVELQRFIKEGGMSRSTLSFADYLAVLNGAFQELDRTQMPPSDDVVNELMIFLSHENVRGYVSEDYSTARILVRHDISSTHDLEHFVADLQAFIGENLDPGLNATITGQSVLTLSATKAMIGGQLQSILLLITFIVVVIALLFTDVRVGLLAALPNAFPVIVLFGVMGYADIPLNIGTTMAAAIAIGIAVDDTMHFMLRYNQELKAIKSQSAAMRATIHDEALPVVATSVALVAGFLVFALSGFAPVALFGLLSALVIAMALVADFVITPLAMSSLRLVTLWDLLSAQLRREVIPNSPLFKGMRPWQIRRFMLSSTMVDYPCGTHVFRVGDLSAELYLVVNGVVEVSLPGKGPDKTDLVVDQFGPGELFGDVALLAGELRKSNAIARETASLLVLSREAIASTTLFHPMLAARLFLNLAQDVSRRWVGFIGEINQHREKDVPAKEQNTSEGNAGALREPRSDSVGPTE